MPIFKDQILIDRPPYTEHTRNYHMRTRCRDIITGNADELFAALRKIEGIESFAIENYYVSVTKSPVFEWNEIERSVLEALPK